MNLHPRLVITCVALELLACAAQAERAEPSAGGAMAVGGASGSGGAGSLRPPVAASSGGKLIGASPAACEGSPTPEPDIVRACVLAASCSPFTQPSSVSECIVKALPASGALPACMLAAQSCAEASACVGAGFYQGPCAADAIEPVCVGTALVQCWSLPPYFDDCAKRGADCMTYERSEDGALTADCTVADTCSTPSDVHVCDGTKRVLCQQGIAFGEDCAAQGLTCVDTPDGAVCTKDPPDCAAPGTGGCDESGNVAYCDLDGTASSFDCARLGFVCREDPRHPQGALCVAPACSADDAARCREECDGPMAHLCLGGQRFSVDCRDYGIQSCLLETRAGEGDRARCGYY